MDKPKSDGLTKAQRASINARIDAAEKKGRAAGEAKFKKMMTEIRSSTRKRMAAKKAGPPKMELRTKRASTTKKKAKK